MLRLPEQHDHGALGLGWRCYDLCARVATACHPGAERIEGGVPAGRALIEAMKARFLASGGTILEDTAFRSAEVYPEGLAIRSSPVCLLLQWILAVLACCALRRCC